LQPEKRDLPADSATGAPEGNSSEERAMVARIFRFSLGSWMVLAIAYAVRLDWWGLFGLTCGGAVVMINFLWLEGIIVRALQPAPEVQGWKIGLGAIARFGLFGVAIALSIFVVRFNPLSVLLGFSVLVIGIGCEVLYAVYRASRGAA
jgi:hypothetical protein